jgi:glycosyltransferase involved in cell wall biosynthesis
VTAVRAVRVEDLPPPPRSRTGWPWAPDLALAPASWEGDWPVVTVVTPVLNQSAFIEETVRSVLLQGYPALEYIVRDGGSRDGTWEIVRRYEPWLTCVSEPDGGQSDAIARGFAQGRGSLVAWLNGDDTYRPGALRRAAEAHRRRPEAVLCGEVLHVDACGAVIDARRSQGLTFESAVRYWEGRAAWQQPGIFVPRAAYDRAGGLDVSLQLAMDYDLLCRLLQAGAPVHDLGGPVATFRVHAAAKTTLRERDMILETSRVSRRYWPAVGVRETEGHDRFLRLALLGAARRALRRGRVFATMGLLAAAGRMLRSTADA